MLTLLRRPPAMPTPSYNPDTPALAPALGQAYAAQCKRATKDGDDTLQHITSALVRRLKRDGLAPERVLVAIKAAIARHGDEHRRPSLARGECGHTPAGEVYDRVFRRFLDTYFEMGK